MTTKKCSRCHDILELNEFSRDRQSKDGLKYQCKLCVKECRPTGAAADAKREQYNLRHAVALLGALNDDEWVVAAMKEKRKEQEQLRRDTEEQLRRDTEEQLRRDTEEQEQLRAVEEMTS